MNNSFDIAKIDKFPTGPGVYVMRNRGGSVLYVGKAKNLRQRIRQYFFEGRDGRHIIPFLTGQIQNIETISVSSEKEALLLENTLIKQNQPKYNALLKDDKTYIAIRIAHKTAWPSIEIVRIKTKIKDDALYFGPYTSALSARNTVNFLQKLFPLRQCSDAEFAKRTRPCILYDLKKCLAPCVQKCTEEDYKKNVSRIIAFLKGQDKQIIKELEAEMYKCADLLQFEQAASYQKMIHQIETTIQKQHVDIPQGRDADFMGIYREADEVALCQMLVRGGKLIGSRIFNFSNVVQDNSEVLESFFLQHYEPEITPPKEIYVAEQFEDANVVSDILSNLHGFKITVQFPQRGPNKALTDLAKMNAMNAFKQEKDEAALKEKKLLLFQETLRLKQYPERIECIDNSHLSGGGMVSVMVAFTKGFKDKSRYRTYKSSQGVLGDDYAALREVLMRRYHRAKQEADLPDLVIIDGGKGHLNQALKIFEELNIITVDLIGLAKEESRHDKGITQEQIFLPNVKDPILLKRNSPILFMLQEIRDEAHRFAINFQKKQRSKKIVASALDEIPGIGPIKKKALLVHFGSVKAIKDATLEQLCDVPGINKFNAEKLVAYFQKISSQI